MTITEHKLGIEPDYQYLALKKGNIFQRQWHNNRLILMKKHFEPKKKELACDIGCGSGNVIFAFSSKAKQFDALDYNRDCLSFIDKKMHDLKIKNVKSFFWNILSKPPKVLRSKYDKAVLNEVIEHFHQKELDVLLKNINMILKNDGQLLITTPNCGISIWPMLEFFIDKFNIFPKLWGEQHKVRLTRASLKNICKKNKFKVIKEGSFGHFSPFMVIFGKKIANRVAEFEIKYLSYFGPQLYVVLKKNE